MALPKRYGIERGWPVGPGQRVADSSGGIPSNVITFNGQPITYNGQYVTYGASV
jgi:hypothetical protein